jgi:hypothetical protein
VVRTMAATIPLRKKIDLTRQLGSGHTSVSRQECWFFGQFSNLSEQVIKRRLLLQPCVRS